MKAPKYKIIDFLHEGNRVQASVCSYLDVPENLLISINLGTLVPIVLVLPQYYSMVELIVVTLYNFE